MTLIEVGRPFNWRLHSPIVFCFFTVNAVKTDYLKLLRVYLPLWQWTKWWTMNYKLLVSQVALSQCFTSTGKKLRKHVPKLLFWGRIFLDKISLKLVTFHITKTCKNAWYICIYVCVVYDVYIMSRWVTLWHERLVKKPLPGGQLVVCWKGGIRFL